MRNKKIVVSLIISILLIIAMIGNVNAANYTFTFTANPTQVTAKLGQTITVNLGIADIDQETDGINAIQGDVSYDKDLFESVEIVSAGNNWAVSLNNEENNSLKGRFVISNMNSIKEAGTVAVLKATIKADATVTTGTINLKDVFSSYGTTETAKTNKTITVNIKAEENNNPTVPDNNGGTTEPDNNPTEQKPSTTKNNTPATNTNKTNSKVSKLPKAGLSSWVVVGIVVAVVGAVIGFIRYKKIY